jgi:branched-chain amino acid transport system substrate-binding protein
MREASAARPRRARRAAVGALVLGASALAGCGSSSSSGSGSGSAAKDSSAPVRIGVEIAQTGDAASLGVPALQGIRFTVDEINKGGGIAVGNGKRKIELVVRDDASNPDTARAVTQQLITDDKVDAIIGGVYSNVVTPALVVAERYGVPDITTFAYSPAVLPKNAKFSFVNVPSTVDEFRGPLALMKAEGLKSVGLVATNDDLGQGFLSGMPALVKKYGLTVGGTEQIEGTQSDFSPIMSRLKSMNVDGVIVEAGPPLSYQFRVAQAKFQACKFQVSHYEYGPSLQPDWTNGTKSAGIGAIAEAFWWSTAKGYQDRWFGDNAGFVKAFKATGKTASWSTAQGVQSAELMALAIEKAGSTDHQAIADGFMALRGSTLMGPIKFDPDHFNRGFIDKELVVQQQRPGLKGAVIIYPQDQATGKFQPDHC